MAGTHDIIEEMQAIAPMGLERIDYSTRQKLQHLTGLLIQSDITATAEYDRFLGIRRRELDLSRITNSMRAAYRGRRVLVTGGTGCIGTALIRQLMLCQPGEVFSVARGRREHVDPVPGVVYLNADVTDPVSVRLAFAAVAPDVVFHLAAQRSPWLAERAVEETVMTNVIGTRNVLRACREYDVPRFVHASTGKAMRYYTTDVYAATKKIAEHLVQEYAAEGHLAGSGRFTHVVDNGVILDKIDEAIDDPQGVCRIHQPDIEFYVQSAIESAQLLLLAGLNDNEHQLQMLAIRCLGDPARLLPMTLGKLSQYKNPPPIYFSGYDKGYERGNPPGLYDPLTAVDLSPLINAVEATTAQGSWRVPAVDHFALALPGSSGGELDRIVDELYLACTQRQNWTVLTRLAQAGQMMVDSVFDQCPPALFTRLSAMATRAGTVLPGRAKENAAV